MAADQAPHVHHIDATTAPHGQLARAALPYGRLTRRRAVRPPFLGSIVHPALVTGSVADTHNNQQNNIKSILCINKVP